MPSNVGVLEGVLRTEDSFISTKNGYLPYLLSFQIIKEIETKVEANQEVNRVAVEEKGN